MNCFREILKWTNLNLKLVNLTPTWCMELRAPCAIDGQINMQFYLHLAEGGEAEILQHLHFCLVSVIILIFIE
jgi:hypothetical protein